jgi:hypothetical protein
MSGNRDSLPAWTAGIRVARAFSGITTGATSFEDLVVAVEDANREREQDEEHQR